MTPYFWNDIQISYGSLNVDIKISKINNTIHQGYSLLSRDERRSLFIILFFSIILSAIEIVGITAIMPFISVASNPNLIETNKYFHLIYQNLGFHSSRMFAVVFGFTLVGFYLIRGGYSLFYLKRSCDFTAKIKNSLGKQLFAKYLSLSYKDYVDKNSNTLQSNVSFFPEVLSQWMQSLLLLLSELLVSSVLYLLLLIVNFKMTLVLTIILGVKVLLLSKITLSKLKANGAKLIEFSRRVASIKGAALGNFKIIKLRSNQAQVMEDFITTNVQSSKMVAFNQVLQQFPRVLLETVGFSMLIGVVIYILMRSKDLSVLIPIISMYALALYRMLPSLNKIIANYNQIVFYSSAVSSIQDELSMPSTHDGDMEILFNDKIVLDNISFKYNNSKLVINNISLTIKKGESLAFVGESGSGKSTLIDLIIGIYKPSGGKIIVDDVELNNDNIQSWRRKFGYIPQSIYLFDGTVAENVAFGSRYDEDKIIASLKKANIYEFLSTKQGINTQVGDGGIQLSGGQKQRIGIARALYTDPEILVLDEATSALDTDTETEVMNEIYKLSSNKTLLVVAHRLSTVERCDRVIKIVNGVVNV